MSGTKRRIDPSVAERLLDEPYRFQFFQAVRMLEHIFTRQGERAQNVVPSKLTFRNTLNMGFPVSDIEKLEARTRYEAANEPDADNTQAQLDGVDITPAFMGMLGVEGVLPSGYTEHIGHREVFYRDKAARAFLDIFTNRAVALYYAAWKKYRLALQYELDREAGFMPIVLSLAGVGSPALRKKQAAANNLVPEQARAYFSGSMVQRPVSAVAIQQVLSDYFSVPIKVEQFVGAWYDVPDAQRTRLGTKSAALGRNALAGSRVWQRNLRLCLWIGPLTQQQFHEFLPGEKAAASLAQWIKLMAGDSLEFQARLVLEKRAVKPFSLHKSKGGRLGFDTFLSTRPSCSDRAATNYLINVTN